MAEEGRWVGWLSTPCCLGDGPMAAPFRFCIEMRAPPGTLRAVSSREPHLSELHLVEKCIDHDERALALLRELHRGAITAFLVSAGATGAEAAETVESLWADLLTPTVGGKVRLQRYDGSCKLLTWLNTVAFNALLTRKRIDGRRERRFVPLVVDAESDSAGRDESVEFPLLELLREAVEFAFANCPAEDFVLLQLEHYDELERGELARMFGCSKATVSRMLGCARTGVAEATVGFLRQRDPWLELKWEDFIELCRTATPAFFGVDGE